MKGTIPSFARITLPLAVFQLGLFLAPALRAGVTATLTPAAVSNTFGGSIMLVVSNLAGGGTVVVQKFLDLNNNGVVDARDWLVQQFNLTDGQAGMVIGGVTNSNVPGDTDTTPGQITAKLLFQGGDFIQNIAGQYLYVVSSPSGSFAPITNLFTVTNSPYPQSIAGSVVSNGTSTTVPGAVVLLFAPPRAGHSGPDGAPLAGVVADNSGSYTIPAPAGTYMPVAFQSNYLANFASGPALTLGSSAAIRTNLTLTSATASLTGAAVDAGNASIGLPGIFVPVQAANGLLGVGFTDTNGNFTVGVASSPAQWSLGSEDSGLIVHGYVGWNNDINVNAGATGVTLAYPKATALFYGTVMDSQGNPLAGVRLSGNQNDGASPYAGDATTGQNGNYAMAVNNAGVWNAGVSGNNPGFPNYLWSGWLGDMALTNGQAARWNFTGLLATNSITGTVKDNNNNPIAGVGVSASAVINGVSYQSYADTDGSGNYTLNAGNGTWSLSINCNNGGDSLSHLGSYACPNGQFAVISGNNATNIFIVQVCGGISIAPSLPPGEVGAYYNNSLQASSCSSTFTWSLLSGSPPPGLTGNPSTGEITGTPTVAGTFNFTVQVTDGNGLTTNGQISIGISNALQITTETLANGANGAAYSQPLHAAGGQPPYTWSLWFGSLPPGLSLSSGGLISGEPALAGAFSFSAQVTDNLGGVAAQFFPVNLTIVNYSNAQSIVLKSDANTQAASQGGLTALDTGNTLGLTFQPVLAGAYGSATPLPPGAPAGTEVVQIPPADGESGFFLATFTLPQTFSGIQLTGAANADDYGRVFLNGNPLTPSLTSGEPGTVSEFGNATFWTTNAGWFVPGTNQILVCDQNTGGPSGAAFYAAISYVAGSSAPPPTLGSPARLSGGQFQFLLTGAAGQNYTILMSTNLGSTNWTPLFVTNSAAANSFEVIDNNATNNPRFYRVKTGP